MSLIERRGIEVALQPVNIASDDPIVRRRGSVVTLDTSTRPQATDDRKETHRRSRNRRRHFFDRPRPIGVRLREWRRQYSLSTHEFAKIADMFPGTLNGIELGHIEFPSPSQIECLHRGIVKIAPDNFSGMEIREGLQAKQKEKQWLITTKDLSLGQSMRYLRLATGLSKKEYARNAGLNAVTLALFEAGEGIPTVSSVNNVIDASEIDPYSKAAQLLRLKTADSMEPMTIEELAKCSIGYLVKYVRTLYGLTKYDVSRILGKAEDTILRLESDSFRVDSTMQDEIINTWLRLDPQGNFAQIIRYKAEHVDDVVPSELLTSQVYSEGILFAEHLTALRPIKLPRSEMAFVKNKKVNELLKSLRLRAGLTQKQVAENMAWDNRVTQADISNFEKGKKFPEENTTALLAFALGFDIHNPMMHYIQMIADTEREVIKDRVRATASQE